MPIRTLCLLLGLLSSSTFAEQPGAVLYMPEAMPLAAMAHEDRHGIFGDIALEALKRAHYAVTIKSEPVLRAMKHLREEEDLLLTPFTRTLEREDDYTWIAAVLPLARAFFTFSDPVQNIEEARARYTRVGVSAGTAQGEILRSLGFRPEQIYTLQLGDQPIKMLELKRIDAWFTTVPEGRYDWVRHTGEPLMMSPQIATADMYLTCSKRCNIKLIVALRDALETMRADGSISRIQERYLGSTDKEANGSSADKITPP